jgi:uncharacterized protein YecE (DUF72 family)
MKARNTYIGTSGWMYKDWGVKFYPKDLKKGHLPYLAGVFNTVEVNSSFYHLPLKTTFEKWAVETPKEFVFAIKLSRYITHLKRLEYVAEPLQNFLANAAGLGKKLGVVLVQLPPSLRYDARKAREFFKELRAAGEDAKIRPLRIAFEPRHKSWFTPEAIAEILPIMRKFRVSPVFAHSTRFQSYPAEAKYITTSFVYLRFHGPRQMFASEYTDALLRPWARKVKAWRKEKPTLAVFAYFNNDVNGYAPWDAQALQKLLGVKRRGAIEPNS